MSIPSVMVTPFSPIINDIRPIESRIRQARSRDRFRSMCAASSKIRLTCWLQSRRKASRTDLFPLSNRMYPPASWRHDAPSTNPSQPALQRHKIHRTKGVFLRCSGSVAARQQGASPFLPARHRHRHRFRRTATFPTLQPSRRLQHVGMGETGLGLAISKRLCELMGGEIWWTAKRMSAPPSTSPSIASSRRALSEPR